MSPCVAYICQRYLKKEWIWSESHMRGHWTLTGWAHGGFSEAALYRSLGFRQLSTGLCAISVRAAWPLLAPHYPVPRFEGTALPQAAFHFETPALSPWRLCWTRRLAWKCARWVLSTAWLLSDLTSHTLLWPSVFTSMVTRWWLGPLSVLELNSILTNTADFWWSCDQHMTPFWYPLISYCGSFSFLNDCLPLLL